MPMEWDLPTSAMEVPDDTPLTDQVEEDLESFTPAELSRASASETRTMKKRIAELEAREAERGKPAEEEPAKEKAK